MGTEFELEDGSYPRELQCPICLSGFDEPWELIPCGHVFCKSCCNTLRECPSCRNQVQFNKAANRIIVNMADGLAGTCSTCDWAGTRVEFRSHQCPNFTQCPQPPPPPRTTTTGSAGGPGNIDPLDEDLVMIDDEGEGAEVDVEGDGNVRGPGRMNFGEWFSGLAGGHRGGEDPALVNEPARIIAGHQHPFQQPIPRAHLSAGTGATTAGGAPVVGHPILIGNSCTTITEGEWYDWTMFVRPGPGAGGALPNQIRKVTFVLHPTFNPPTVEKRRGQSFEVNRRGWGTFTIKVKIYSEGQSVPFTWQHELDFRHGGKSSLVMIPAVVAASS